MTEIYLIRHVQAEGNRYRMMQGHWDGNVTDFGRQQIDALAERLRGEKLDAVYASDLYRTRMTASAVTRYHDLPLHTTDRLREIHVGRWETLFFGNVIHDEPELAYAFMHDQDKFSIEGGETYAQVGQRALAALEQIARNHPGQTVAVVSHGVTIRCLLSRITGIPLRDPQLPIVHNGSITRLRWKDGRFTLEATDDHAHLDALGEVAWNKLGDLRDEPLDPLTDRDYYTDCYADAWRSAHGDLTGFSPDSYFEAAKRHLEVDGQAVLRLYRDDEPVGLVDLDPLRGSHAGYGWVSLLYLCPEYRYQGYGPQALARAIFHFRRLGRRSLRLHVAEENTSALRFYRKEGFRQLSYENGSRGRLLLMEKSLEGPGHG